jgi:hypothetical protein
VVIPMSQLGVVGIVATADEHQRGQNTPRAYRLTTASLGLDAVQLGERE